MDPSNIPGFTPLEEEKEEQVIEGFTPDTVQEVDTSAFEGFTPDSDMQPQESYIPSGFTAGEYTQDSMVENDSLYQPIYDYMELRYGLQAVEGQSREQIVDRFLNNRRGNAMGNSVRAISEADFLYDIKDDQDKLAKAGKAYGIYENMANMFSEHTTGWERAEGIMDATRSVILDPINVVGGIIGKAAGGTATKVGVKTLNKMATKAAMTELKRQGSKAGAKAAATAVYKAAANTAQKKAAVEMTEYAAKLSATKGFQRVMTKAGIKEVAGATLADAIASTGTEWLYQRSLVQTDVQEGVNPYAVGLAALSSMAMGGIQAARVATRGTSGQALVSETVKQGDPKKVAEEMRKSIVDYMTSNKLDSTSSWASKVEGGEELAAKDTDFFVELLLGRSDEEGNTVFKGLGQVMQENGFYFMKRTEDDKVSNWVADFIKDMDDADVQGIVKAYSDNSGNAIKGLEGITAEEFGDIFARKMNQGARTMNAARQVADTLEIDLEDLDVDQYLQAAMGLNLVKKPPSKFDQWGAGAGAGVRKAQNNMIRSLVSHPSTSALNVVGYGAASTLSSANDVVNALLFAGRGSLEHLVGMSKEGATHIQMSKALMQANANRVRLLLDPDMTQEAFKSALLRNTGAMEQLSRVQSGGVEISSGIGELTKMGPTQRAFWYKAEGGIDVIQTATFVDAQDIFTKSQEYVFQMDKNLRATFNKGWDEFYNSPDAVKIMATKQYKELESTAVDKTLEMTFSKSYKGGGALGEAAGFIEDARNIPGLGALVPFGKFFNNTVDFMVKNSPVSLAAKVAGMGYKDVPIQELVTRSVVAGGVVYAFAQGEDEKRRQGLGLYEVIDPLTGEVRSKQYDYPISLFQAAGRVMAYKQAGETVPDEVAGQIIRDFFGGSLTRNIAKSGDVMVDAVASLVKLELEDAAGKAKQSAGAVGTQLVSSYSRFLEPVNELVGLAAPDRVERRPELNDATGLKKQFKDSMRYVENFGDLVMGKGSTTIKQSSSEGEMDPQGTKSLGVRVETHTDTLRVMQMLGYEGWQLNAAFKITKASPELANKYQENFFKAIEHQASSLMQNSAFRELTTEQQRILWAKKVEKTKVLAKRNLYLNEEVTGTDYKQFQILDGNSAQNVKDAMEELGLEGDIFEQNRESLVILENYLDNKATLDYLDIPDAAKATR